jgi:hypothetical protein
MKQAHGSLEKASHKLAEAMYKTASQAPPPPSGSAAGGDAAPRASDEDQVIDAEYVDSEGGKR